MSVFSATTRAEPGNLFFEWSVDTADWGVFVLLEVRLPGRGLRRAARR
ncbi:putative quinol monooxygenase [Streptomyces sp. NPDC088801]